MVTDEDAGTIFFIETQKRNMQTLPFPPLDERSASIDFPHGYSRFHSKHCKNNGKQSMAPQTFKSLREINKFVGVDGASRKEGSACFVFLSADTVGVDWTALDWKEAATLEIDSEPGAAQLRGRRTLNRQGRAAAGPRSCWDTQTLNDIPLYAVPEAALLRGRRT